MQIRRSGLGHPVDSGPPRRMHCVRESGIISSKVCTSRKNVFGKLSKHRRWDRSPLPAKIVTPFVFSLQYGCTQVKFDSVH